MFCEKANGAASRTISRPRINAIVMRDSFRLPEQFLPRSAVRRPLGQLVLAWNWKGLYMKKAKAPQSIQEKAYSYLRGKILSGELAPGAALSEVSIARELGNSRGPLREAIRRLRGEGFLQQTPSGGSVVVDFSRRDVAEL